MAKVNFNDHLDDMMERLMDEKLSIKDLDKEINRSKAICQIADRKLEHNKSIINAMSLVSKGEMKLELIETKLLK
jgi:hypothetical protein